MESNTSALTEETILGWVGSRNLDLGRSYFEGQAIIDPRRQGGLVKALCRGSIPQPYRLRVDLGLGGIVTADCSCPVGGGGRCKHVAALLLAWLHAPDTFSVMEDIDTVLEGKSKPELIAVIKRMLTFHPDLETLLESALPGEERKGRPLDPESYRRQVSAAFERGAADWYASRRVSVDIGITIGVGDEFLGLADYEAASIVYQAVARGIIENYELVHDDDGDLCEALDRCVMGLDTCLSNGGSGAASRNDALDTLFAIYLFNQDYGGGDSEVTAPDVILDHASADEKGAIAARIRAAMPAGDSWSRGYRRRAYGSFLLELESVSPGSDAFLEICRETGQLSPLVDCLLNLGRTEEALAEARLAEDYDLLNLTKVFLENGYAQLVEPLVYQRIGTTRYSRLLDWLEERRLERGELVDALEIARMKLERSPSLADYVNVRKLSQEIGTWHELRPQLLKHWATGGQHRLLTEIHLEEDEIDLALEAAKQVRSVFRSPDNLLIRVAQAASQTHPQDALNIYQSFAEGLIAIQGRENYRQACALLARMRDLYLQLSQTPSWTALIAQLRERYRRLPALQEELTNAGL